MNKVGHPTEISDEIKAKVRAHYEAGTMTYREMTLEYGVSMARISQWKKNEGWKRDEESDAVIEQKRNEQLAVIQQNALVAEEKMGIIDAAARTQAEVVSSHKRQIDKYVKACDRLLDEFIASAMTQEQMLAIAELNCIVNNAEATPEALEKSVQAVKKLLSIGERAETFHKLAAAKEKLVNLERRACGIKDDDGKAREPIEIILNMGANAQTAIVLNAENKGQLK